MLLNSVEKTSLFRDLALYKNVSSNFQDVWSSKRMFSLTRKACDLQRESFLYTTEHHQIINPLLPHVRLTYTLRPFHYLAVKIKMNMSR